MTCAASLPARTSRNSRTTAAQLKTVSSEFRSFDSDVMSINSEIQGLCWISRKFISRDSCKMWLLRARRGRNQGMLHGKSVAFAVVLLSAAVTLPAQEIEFNRDIRPLL